MYAGVEKWESTDITLQQNWSVLFLPSILYRRYCLGDSLLALCLSKHIPIIPLKLDQTALFNLTTDSKKPITVRTTCIGITKVTVIQSIY